MRNRTGSLLLVSILCGCGPVGYEPIVDGSGSGDGSADSGDIGSSSDGSLDATTTDGGDSASSDAPRDGTVADSADAMGPTDPRTAYCMGNGPPITVGDGTSGDAGVSTMTRCTGSLAATTFRFAMCTCDGLTTSSSVTTDAFDSMTGMSVMGVAGAVGSNGPINAGTMNIGGSLWTSSVQGIVTNAVTTVGGVLRSGGDLSGGGRAVVGLDAYVNGNVSLSDIRVAGTLTLPTGKTISPPAPSIGSVVRAPVAIEPPCDCDVSRRPGITQFIRTHTVDNDNAVVPVRADAYTNVQGTNQLVLPCGRFYLNSILGSGSLTVRVTGRTALFVDGNISVNGALSFSVDPGAELDVFVAGNFNAAGPLDLGSRTNPSRVRLYVAGTGSINLASGAVLAGNLYAPDAEIVTAGALEVFGSIFARRISAGGTITIHYDTAILRASETCAPPVGMTTDGGVVTPGDSGTDGGAAPSCGSCRDCSNQACVNGRCGSCTNDGQCCAPLLCRQGRCQYVPG